MTFDLYVLLQDLGFIEGIVTKNPVHEINKKPKSFTCKHCGALLGFRNGDTITADRLEVTFKRTHKIRCGQCGRQNDFNVDYDHRKGVKV